MFIIFTVIKKHERILMAYVEKLGHSLKENWSLIGRYPIIYYTPLNIIAVYVVTLKIITIINLVGQDLELYFLGSFFTCMILSLLIGAYLNERLKLKGHLLWNLFGVFFGITLMLSISGFNGLVLYSILGGFSLGFCIPGIITLVINMTNYENRGSISGTLIMITYVFIIICSVFIDTAIQLGIVLSLAKLVNMFIASKIDFVKSPPIESPFIKYGITVKASFALIWFIFNLVDAIMSSIIAKHVSGYDFDVLQTVTLIIGLVSMFLVGFLMDDKGRKKLLIFCYACLGLEYAMISLLGVGTIKYAFFDGIAWGILTVYFLMVLAGDIIFPKMRALFISVMITLAIIGQYLREVFYMENISAQVEQIFPLTVLFLFIAAVVMLILPETLPDKVIRKKELQDYLQKAKKIKEKQL
jgi:MFS family permease